MICQCMLVGNDDIEICQIVCRMIIVLLRAMYHMPMAYRVTIVSLEDLTSRALWGD